MSDHVGAAAGPRPAPLQHDSWYGEDEAVARPARHESGGLPQLARLLARHKLEIGGLTVLGIVLAALVTLLMTPIYRARASIQVERETSRVLDIQDVQPVEQALEAERFLQTQIELLQSESVATEVARRLRLFTGNHFLRQMHEKPTDIGGDPADLRLARQEQVVKLLGDNLSVDWNRNSRIVRLLFDSPDPALSARVANTFAQAFIAANLERRLDSTVYARDFLDRRLAQVKQRLEDSEREMIGYARREQLIDVSEGDQANMPRGPRSLTAAKLVLLNNGYAAAREQRLQAEERWRQSAKVGVFKLPEVMSNDAIQLLLQKRAERRAEYQNQLRVFRPNYEPMQQLSADIAELDSQVNAAANNIRDTLRTQYEVSRRQEQALASDVGELKAETLDEQRRSIRYNILKREAETNRVLYDALLQRYKEVSLAGGLAVSNVTVIDQARSARKPVQPRPLLNMAAGGLLGLILALALVVARSRFDDTVRSPADLEGKLGLPLLGITPAMTKGREPLEVLAEARSDLSEAFASVRAALDLASARGAPKPLLVTSTRESEGKSTSAAALAVSFARIGRDVLLIDADLRRPSLHTMFGLPRTKGLSTLLASHDGLADAVQPTTWPNLSVVAAGPPPPSPSGLLAEPRLRGILQEAAAKYDVVIVDAPPVMGLADVPLLAAAAAGVVYVVEAARTHRGQLRVALARIRAVDGTVVGALLTKFDPKEAAVYGGDYASAYRYGYGEAA